MCVLDPKVAMSASNQRRPKSLANLASKFPMLVEESQLDQLHDNAANCSINTSTCDGSIS